ncbi:MAG TPA: DUF1318 domain-containing protein [Gammaproteobacteria bacterium]|nr:DUF1318 domain-containing protein [Gammaproteobacteria bacterium]
MLNVFRNKFYWVVPALLALALFALPAAALNLAQAKAQGLVKETPSGYIAAVKPSAEVKALVGQINAGRKAEYQKIAKKRGTPLSVVEQLAGQKLTK